MLEVIPDLTARLSTEGFFTLFRWIRRLSKPLHWLPCYNNRCNHHVSLFEAFDRQLFDNTIESEMLLRTHSKQWFAA